MKQKLLGILLMLTCVAVHADAQQPPHKGGIRLLLKGALEFGGDEVAKVLFTNGNTQSVRAGQGGSLGAGAEISLPGVQNLLLQTTIGYKYVTTEADNVHIRLTRIPIIMTANYMATKKLRLGAGLAMHQNIKFNAGGIGQNMQFDPAKGPVFEVAYSGIGLSYTTMKYTDNQKNSYSANAVGVIFSLTIPKN